MRWRIPARRRQLLCRASSSVPAFSTSASASSRSNCFSRLAGAFERRLKGTNSFFNNCYSSLALKVGFNLDLEDESSSIIDGMGKVLFIDSLKAVILSEM